MNPFFSVNYLSRYHLTRLLLPTLPKVEDPRVLLMTASIPPDEAANVDGFPDYRPFKFSRDRRPIQLANHHYAAHLHLTEPKMRTAVLHAGAGTTGDYDKRTLIKLGPATTAKIMTISWERICE